MNKSFFKIENCQKNEKNKSIFLVKIRKKYFK